VSEPDLGKCLAEYKTSAGGFAKVVIMMLVSFAVAAGLFSVSIGGAHEALGGRIVLFVLGLLFSLPGLLGVYGLSRGRKNALRFHERGIAIHKAGQEKRIAWDEIASYSDGAFLVIETKGGDAIDFGMDGLANASEVVPRLREEVTIRRALQRLRATIRDGKTVEFEGLDAEAETAEPMGRGVFVTGFTLDAKGIAPSNAKQPIPWAEITACGTAEAKTKGKVPVATTWVLLRTTSGNYRALIDPVSERDALTALCKELSPALS
jgi:hypothetical protein